MNKGLIAFALIVIVIISVYFFAIKPTLDIVPPETPMSDADLAAFLAGAGVEPTSDIITTAKTILGAGATVTGLISALTGAGILGAGGAGLGLGGAGAGAGLGTSVIGTGLGGAGVAGESAAVAGEAVASTGSATGLGTVAATAGIALMAVAVAYFLYVGIKGVFDGGNYEDLLFTGDRDKDWARLQWWFITLPEGDGKSFFFAPFISGMTGQYMNPNTSTFSDMRYALVKKFNEMYPGIVNPETFEVDTNFKPSVAYSFIGDGQNRFIPIGSSTAGMGGGSVSTFPSGGDDGILNKNNDQVAQANYSSISEFDLL